MKKRRFGFISGILIIAVLVNVAAGFGISGDAWALMGNIPLNPPVQTIQLPSSATVQIDSSASSWAIPHLQQAYEYGLTYPGIMKDFKKPITRQEFCTIVVKLYEKLSGKTATAGSSPFTDTSDPEIIKAYQLGIVKGTGAGKFSPGWNITRQEICVMIFRALDVAVTGLDKSIGTDFPFSDKGLIASWAADAMKFAYKNNIMNGVGGNRIDPLSNTTREQAITLIKRTYEAFRVNVIDATISVGQADVKKLTEKEKFINSDLSNRIAFPRYDSRLELFVATEAGKPAKRPSAVASGGTGRLVRTAGLDLMVDLKPIQPVQPNLYTGIQPSVSPVIPPYWLLPRPEGSIYTKAQCAALIDRDGNKKRWFAFNLNTSQAAKVVWQVSKAPFNGFSDSWKYPRGLVASGEVSAQAGEFVIDFGPIAAGQSSGIQWQLKPAGQLLWSNTSTYKEIPKAQKKYYVRAVPVDSSGKCIGDPGEGLEVLYGEPLTAAVAGQNLNPSFELWAPMWEGEAEGGGPDNLGYSGEFPNLMVHETISHHSDSRYTSDYWFLFHGFDPAVTRVVMQVAAKPFTGSMVDWDAPKGLVYSKSYTNLPVKLNTQFENAVPIKFSQFGPDESIMKPDEFISYYVRAVAVKPSNIAGSEEVAFSETITVNYGYPSAPKWFIPQDVSVKSYIPNIKVLHYRPVQWEDPEWEHKYIVYRAPKWNEINCTFKNVQTGQKLYPYYHYVMSDATITPAKYENEIIPKVLVKGTSVTIVDKESDKSWWGELWDSIVDFFSSIIDIIKNITNWVSSAYANLKSGLINFVASNFPLIPDNWRAGLKLALEALVNTGMAAMGIPPTLPNFDQLSNMSLDYMAQVALTEAGIPANEITNELVTKTAEGLGNEITAATNSASPNPINSAFLKNHPDYLYRPAYMDIEISNPYDKPSLPGSFNIDAEWEWTEEVSLDHEVFSHWPQEQQFADALQYVVHFLYGLSRGRNGYPIYYPVYEPVRGQPIPILQPGEKRTVRIYLKPYTGKPYPFAINGDSVLLEDFAHLYWGDVGKVEFRVRTDKYDLPDPEAVAKAQGFQEDDDHIYTYGYDKLSSGSYFEQVPCQSY
ncbi:S-layer homology domain-containing protein [Phosphitispora sp. TUW77]|uniref:S-layer homology domain-containing protein n=1 Tax=Phosphitispora sp. TUW77 TaxID=3152361 RepID=UPI003AB90D01